MKSFWISQRLFKSVFLSMCTALVLCTVSCIEVEELIHSRKPAEGVIKLVGRIRVAVVDILDVYEIHSTNHLHVVT